MSTTNDERLADLPEAGVRKNQLDAGQPDLAGLRLAIIGSRGYPSTYGGFETLVRRLAPYLLSCGAEVTVYGRDNARGTRVVDGVTSITTRGLDRKSTSTLSFGATAVLDACRRSFDAALVLNVANGYWLPALKRSGIPTAVNVDGIEWERGKWSALGKKVFWYGAKLTARYADCVICDAEAIASSWCDLFGVHGRFIPYGAEVVDGVGVDRLAEIGLEPGGYVLVVSRLIPENNIDLFLDAAEQLDSDLRVVVVGSSQGHSEVETRLERMMDRGSVLWLGHVSDQELLAQLWANTAVYFHGHSVGGTNPALLQAIGFGAPVVAFDTRYNREVLGNDALFVTDSDSLARAIRVCEVSPSQSLIRVAQTRARVRERYDWVDVCTRYANVLGELATIRETAS